MSKILDQKTHKHSLLLLNSSFVAPVEITHIPNTPTAMKSNQNICTAGCLSCVTPYCMKYQPTEIVPQSKLFAAFPVDMNNYVCPTAAISWEKDALYPTINPELCINCGLCASRCPAGAIYLTEDHAVVYSNQELTSEVEYNEANAKIHAQQIEVLSKALHGGKMLNETEQLFFNIFEKMATIKTDAQFPNILTRNLILQTGNRCFVRRRGDVYLRIDAIMELGEHAGIVEIEFNKDSLESPRAILDDIAVLVSRYGIDASIIKPFIVSLEFPNIRTEYWRVIKDISNVLKVKINSLSIGVLLLFVWNFINVDFQSKDFYADVDKPSIKQETQDALKVEPSLDGSKCAVLEPKK